jgi:hypothetical protein
VRAQAAANRVAATGVRNQYFVELRALAGEACDALSEFEAVLAPLRRVKIQLKAVEPRYTKGSDVITEAEVALLAAPEQTP